MWGSAADQDHVYVANSDVRFGAGLAVEWSSLGKGKNS